MHALFLDVTNQLRQDIWPEGEASNLEAAHTRYFKEALYELQRFIPSLQQNNLTIYPFCSTYIRPCGISAVPLPRGDIRRVFTINSDWCDIVLAQETTYQEVDRFSHDNLEVVMPANEGLKALPSGWKFAESTTDSDVGRARYVLWCRYDQRIMLAPWIQSNEKVVVEWTGIKREWADTDALDLDVWDIRVMRVVSLYVLAQHETWFGQDAQRKILIQQDYALAFADLMVQFSDENRPHQNDEPYRLRLPTTAEIDADEVVAADSTLQFAVIGDSGDDSQEELEVSELVKALAPRIIIHTGDVAYSPVTYPNAVTKYYGDYVGDTPALNRFWPVPGNHDWDIAGLATYLAFFNDALLNNKRYYDVAFGPVHFFAVSSDPRETSGNADDSPQAEWLSAKLALSPAKWKVVYFHHGAYSSNANHSGNHGSYETMQWGFGARGADIVFQGHNHFLEDVIVGGIHYVTSGAGGSNDLNNFGTPIEGSEFRYNSQYGAVFCTASCDSLKVDFYNTDRVLLYTFTLHK